MKQKLTVFELTAIADDEIVTPLAKRRVDAVGSSLAQAIAFEKKLRAPNTAAKGSVG